MASRALPVYFSLSWFDKQTEELVGEVPLNVTARELRRILRLPPRAALSDCFPLTRQHFVALRTLLPQPQDLTRFDYFIEASSTPVPAHAHAAR